MVALLHFVDPEEAPSRTWDQRAAYTAWEAELQDDLWDQCSRHGSVEAVGIFPQVSPAAAAVRLATASAAAACAAALDGRYFAGRSWLG